MNRYMLAFTWRDAPDVQLVDAEHRRVIELIEQGAMEQMFLADDRSRGWLVMLADSPEQAQEAAGTLPFFPTMIITTTHLATTYP